jgi:hypothetical protein
MDGWRIDGSAVVMQRPTREEAAAATWSPASGRSMPVVSGTYSALGEGACCRMLDWCTLGYGPSGLQCETVLFTVVVWWQRTVGVHPR